MQLASNLSFYLYAFGKGRNHSLLWLVRNKANAEKPPPNTMIAAHRNSPFVASINIMYTLSWKGCGETIRILFDGEDIAEIWDEFFVFGKAE